MTISMVKTKSVLLRPHRFILTSSLLVKTPVSANMIPEVTTWEVVHDKVEVLTVLEGVVHVDNEGVLELCQDLSLIDHRLHTTLCDDSCLAHLLHGEVLLGLLAFYSPYLAKAALTNAKMVNKVGLWNSCPQKTNKLRSLQSSKMDKQAAQKPICQCCLSILTLSLWPIKRQHT